MSRLLICYAVPIVYSLVCVYVYCMLVCVQDPKLYVHALLEVHNKYKVMVEAAFKGDAGFIQALDKV